MNRYEDDFKEFKRKTELMKSKKAAEFWVGKAMFQLVGTLISGITVLFWTNKFTLWALAIMSFLSVAYWIVAYMMVKAHEKKVVGDL